MGRATDQRGPPSSPVGDRTREHRAVRLAGCDRRSAPASTTRLAAIAALYGTLAVQTGSPVVELNRAIAVAELDGPEAGLAVLDGLELDHYRYFHSARADLLRRAGRDVEAGHAYQRALDLAQTDPERRHLQDQLTRLKPSE